MALEIPASYVTAQVAPLSLKTLIPSIEQSNIPGAVLVASGGRVLVAKAGGEAKIDSPFLIGSLSKQFTAAALLKALCSCTDVHSTLQNPVSKYLPKQHPIWQGNMPRWANEVTLHQLLSHRSGIPNYTDNPTFQGPFYSQKHTSAQILNLIKNEPLRFQPGSKQEYSNTNYLLIAEIITALTNQPFDQFLSQHFFKPLQMHHTSQPTSGNQKTLHLIKSLDSENFIDLSNAQGAGAMISTVDDLHKWNIALHINKTVLPPDLYSLMITNYGEGEGYGIGIATTSCGMIYAHQGKIDTYNSILLYSPQNQITVVALTYSNQSHEQIMSLIENALN